MTKQTEPHSTTGGRFTHPQSESNKKEKQQLHDQPETKESAHKEHLAQKPSPTPEKQDYKIKKQPTRKVKAIEGTTKQQKTTSIIFRRANKVIK